MEVKLSDIFRLRVSDYNCHDRLAPYAILDLFQDIAGKHATSYQMSFEDLKSNNMIWVLLRVKYKVIKEAKLYSNVNVVTWPKKKGLVDFDRVTEIYDLDNNLLVCGVSKWVVLNSDTRKIIPAKHINYNATTCEEDYFNNERFDKLKDFDITNCNHYSYKIEYVDLDHNGHVNNMRYCYMINNAIKPKSDELIDFFQIDFVNESHDGDILDLYYFKEDNSYNIKAISDNKVIFIAKVSLKEQ